MDDILIAGTLNALAQGLEDLTIDAGHFGSRALQALQDKHAGKLTRLNLLGVQVTSAALHSILCSCRWLVYFCGERILSSDVVSDDRAWVCEGLEEWHVAIEMDDEESKQTNNSNNEDRNNNVGGLYCAVDKTSSRKIYARIAALKRISILDMEFSHEDGGLKEERVWSSAITGSS